MPGESGISRRQVLKIGGAGLILPLLGNLGGLPVSSESELLPADGSADLHNGVNPDGDGIFPIVAWGAPVKGFLTDEAVRDIAECHFTACLPSVGRDPDLTWRVLELAERHSLKVLVVDNRIDPGTGFTGEESYAAVDRVISRFSRHPAFLGYYLVDEPSADLFEDIGKISRYLKEHDPDHFSYINLFPNYAREWQLGLSSYKEYVEKYMETVRPEFISYDHYPILNTGMRSEFYPNLEIIREAALRYDTPFWGFTLCIPHGPYPYPIEGHLRFQIYSNLAYGAKGILYFKYWTTASPRWDFHKSLVEPDGTRNSSYYDAQRVNADILALAPLLSELTSVAVYHTDPVPDGSMLLPDGFHIKLRSQRPLCMGIFRDSNQNEYLLVMNRDYEQSNEVEVILGGQVAGLVEYPNEIRRMVRAGDSFKLRLPPGDGKLLEILYRKSEREDCTSHVQSIK